VVDEKDLPFLNGALIDFTQEGLNSFFKLNNPNIDNTCGCGESFSLKDSQ
jgi:iron-sulfur cluster assembly protein